MLQSNSSPDGQSPTRTVLKKYGKNRRLYDTSTSRYVNLDELAAFIREGREVQVVDAKTGEDLTHITLMQIIMDNARDQPTVLPLQLLRQLIVASDHAGREFITWYLNSAFDTYRKVQNALESGLSEVQSAALSPFSLVRNLFQNTGSQKPAENPELLELRRRVAELEARLETAAKPSGRTQSKRRSE